MRKEEVKAQNNDLVSHEIIDYLSLKHGIIEGYSIDFYQTSEICEFLRFFENPGIILRTYEVTCFLR